MLYIAENKDYIWTHKIKSVTPKLSITKNWRNEFLQPDGLCLVFIRSKWVYWISGNLSIWLARNKDAVENCHFTLVFHSVSPFVFNPWWVLFLFNLQEKRETHQSQALSCIIYIGNMLKTLDFLYKRIAVTCSHNQNSVQVVKFSQYPV